VSRLPGVWLVLGGLLALPAAQADAPEAAQTEVNYLLAAVAASDCEFYRNGSWYDASRAAAHLRMKYRSLLARGLIRSADDFIERGATRSSLSGLAYSIRCPGADVVPAAQWLRQLLARYRGSNDQTASPLH
jgi:hypothetical protein